MDEMFKEWNDKIEFWQRNDHKEFNKNSRIENVSFWNNSEDLCNTPSDQHKMAILKGDRMKHRKKKNGKYKNAQKDAQQVWNSYILNLRYTKPKLTELKAEI